mmetsp:Transcript_3884/g.9895  ORF Transcript_3884/g.9895 Transcript_3884/m.9895 type:complete len:545 (+) Transcript_3884:105-1739(+)
MDAPKQESMAWAHAALSNHGMMLFANGGTYEYKVPYSIPETGFCATVFGPACTCCDTCCTKPRCCSLCPCHTPPGPGFMDMVDNDTGDQVRFQRFKKARCCFCCCCLTHMSMYRNGQKAGVISPGTTRCCARCRACIGDCSGGEVRLFTLKDKHGNDFASSTRPGRGCCCKCQPTFPCGCVSMSCMGIPLRIFACIACTCETNPTLGPEMCCGGCRECDPACCECCARGEDMAPLCMCSDIPCWCCAGPWSLINCCCCFPAIEKSDARMKNSIRHETAHIHATHGEDFGQVQMQYRGQVPALWKHKSHTPWKGVVDVAKGGAVGVLAAGLMVAKSWALGASSAMLGDVVFPDRSPDFDGMVFSKSPAEMERLLEALDDDGTVTKDCYLGGKRGYNVKGYTLNEFGWNGALCTCCIFRFGGEMESMSNMQRISKKNDFYWLYETAKKHNRQLVYKMRFYVKDVPIRKNPDFLPEPGFNDYYKGSGLTEVALTCNCCVCYRFPCQFNRTSITCCRLPIYAYQKKTKEVKEVQVMPSEVTPVQVIMT